MSSKNIKYELLPGQYKFVNSTKKQVLYSGGFGSGKSQALGYAIIKQATIPNNVVLLIRKTLTSLKKSTLINLIGGTNPILPPGSYKHNKSEGIIDLHGGGRIYYMGCEDAARIRSMNLGAAYIDEVTEFDKEEFDEISWRLRLEWGCRQLYCVGNPAGQNHFLYKHFFLDDNPNREVITASSLENKYLPTDYIEDLKTMNEALYKRYVEGLWINLDDAIFDSFDRNTHVKALKSNNYEEYIIAIDYGYTHPSGILVAGKRGDRIYILEEYKRPKVLLRDIIAKVMDFKAKYPDSIVIYDPSAAGLGGELENLELNPLKANNDVQAGIDRIRNKLQVRNDEPDIIINSTCTELIKEMENYQYIKGTEKPVKLNDDLVDPLRYICNHACDIKSEYSRPMLITGGDDDDDDDE